MTAESELVEALTVALRVRPGLSARRLADIVWQAGIKANKSVVNSHLYRRSDLFQNDGAVPPAWSLVQTSVPVLQRAPHRVEGVLFKNFKAFDRLKAMFAGITLVYGENSTGKSTILQGLLLMKQSWPSGDLVFEGEYASFGTYRNVVHGHDLERQVTLSALWSDATDEDNAWSVSLVADEEMVEVPSPEHAIEGVLLQAGPVGIWLSRGSERVDDPHGGEPWTLHRGTSENVASRMDLATRGVVIASDENEFPDPWHLLWQPAGVGGYSEEEVAATLRLAQQAIVGATEMFNAVEHVPPYRAVPARGMPLSEISGDQSYMARLYADETNELLPEVNDWLTRFQIPYEVDIIPRQAPRDAADGSFDLELTRIGGAGEKVHLVDVGFGVSQLLPLIAQLVGSHGKTILIEEPEAHVHPRHQSVLADLFIASMQDWGNTLVVETHSEPILLRMQRRIAEERLGADEVSVLHVQREEATSRIEEVPIRADGQLDYVWPGGFFDDRMDDLVAILDPQVEE